MFRCRVCKRTGKGPWGMLACPECGGEVLPISYVPKSRRGRRVH